MFFPSESEKNSLSVASRAETIFQIDRFGWREGIRYPRRYSMVWVHHVGATQLQRIDHS